MECKRTHPSAHARTLASSQTTAVASPYAAAYLPSHAAANANADLIADAIAHATANAATHAPVHAASQPQAHAAASAQSHTAAYPRSYAATPAQQIPLPTPDPAHVRSPLPTMQPTPPLPTPQPTPVPPTRNSTPLPTAQPRLKPPADTASDAVTYVQAGAIPKPTPQPMNNPTTQPTRVPRRYPRCIKYRFQHPIPPMCRRLCLRGSSRLLCRRLNQPRCRPRATRLHCRRPGFCTRPATSQTPCRHGIRRRYLRTSRRCNPRPHRSQ